MRMNSVGAKTASSQSFINAQSAYLPFACRHGHGRSACPGRHEFWDPNSWSPRGHGCFPSPPPPDSVWTMGDGRSTKAEQPIPKTARKSKRIRRWMLPRCLLTQDSADGIGRRTFLLTTDRLQKISGGSFDTAQHPNTRGSAAVLLASPRVTQRRPPGCR